jgi:hypothetical protein
MPDFGVLATVPLRSVWANEARDFTPWLAENIGALGEALGMDLELVQREAEIGDFSLDLLAKDLSTGRHVVVENQFGATNHDHLGKLLTYAAGVDASAVVWIAESIRDEHRQAIEWLNRRTDTGLHFFAVVVEVLRIDSSRPAAVFKSVVAPNEWQETARETTERQTSPKSEAYRRFFQSLIDELRERHRFTGARAGQPQNWYSFSSGMPGITYGMSFAQDGRARTEVYIDQGDADANKHAFDTLLEDRKSIEAALGETLEWERLDNRRASRVALYRLGSIESSEEELGDVRAWAVERLLKLKEVLGPRVRAVLGAA